MTWNIQGKRVLITGATDGIGKAVASELEKRGAKLILLTRNECDLSQLSSVASLDLSHLSNIDVLIHVAGVLPQGYEETEGVERAMAVNYFAPVVLTERLLPQMNRPGRIIFVNSSTHKSGSIDLTNLEGKGIGGYQAYANSKLALMLYALYLSRNISAQDITVASVHPGWIRTKLARAGSGGLKEFIRHLVYMRPPSFGAESIVFLATEPQIEAFHGAYVIKKLPTEPAVSAKDYELAKQLFKLTQLFLSDRFK
jgi:retinol dehydrogenase-12